jgi:hypothetical protein
MELCLFFLFNSTIIQMMKQSFMVALFAFALWQRTLLISGVKILTSTCQLKLVESDIKKIVEILLNFLEDIENEEAHTGIAANDGSKYMASFNSPYCLLSLS